MMEKDALLVEMLNISMSQECHIRVPALRIVIF